MKQVYLGISQNIDANSVEVKYMYLERVLLTALLERALNSD
jgi:hypothetical protein